MKKLFKTKNGLHYPGKGHEYALGAGLAVFALAAFLGWTLVGNALADRPVTRTLCRDFLYQEDAQRYYYGEKAVYLDGDGDGKACDSLPNKPKE